MFSLNDKISARQLQALLLLEIFGTGVIILPRKAAVFGGQNGWMVIIAGTVLALLFVAVITTLGRMFPRQSFLSTCAQIVPKPLAMLIVLGFVARILVHISLEIRFFSEIINQTVLFDTPFWAIFAALMAVGAFAAAKGMETRARIAEVLLPLVFIPLLIVFLFAAADADFTNLLPVGGADPHHIVRGGFYTLVSFTGLEFCLLVFPYMNQPQKARKAAMQAVAALGALMLVITVITFAKFGHMDAGQQLWPVIEMMGTVDFPGSFMERQDALIMSFWIVSVFAIVTAGLFYAAVLLKDVFKKGRHAWYIFACIPLIFAIAQLPRNVSEAYKMMTFAFMTLGILYMGIVPALLLLIAKLRKLGENYET